MFTEKTIYESIILAKDLTARGIRLKVKPETPLQELMAASYPTGTIFKNIDSLLEEIDLSCGYKNVEGNEVHSCLLTKYAWGVGESLNSVISLARNDVNPMLREAIEEINQYLESGFGRNVGILIISLFQPDILKSSNLEDLMARYANNKFIEVSWKNDTWPSIDVDSLKKYAKGFSKDLDNDIEKMLNDLDDEFIVAIYDSVFRNLPIEKNNQIQYYDIYVSILSFLWANNWLVELPDGINVKLSQVIVGLTNLKSNSAKKIIMEKDKFDRMSNSNNFIIKFPNMKIADKNLIVQGEIYNKWLESGGSPEILIGSFFTDKRSNLSNLNDDIKKEYLRKYRLENDMRRQEYDIKKAANITKALSDFIDRKIDELNGNRNILRKRFNDKVRDFPYREKMDMVYWVRKIICHVFFPNTECLAILMAIDSIMEANPEMDVREAATASAIDMISDWIYSTVDVELVPNE